MNISIERRAATASFGGAERINGQHAPNIIIGALVATCIAMFLCPKLTLHHQSRHARKLPKLAATCYYCTQLHLARATQTRSELLSRRVPSKTFKTKIYETIIVSVLFLGVTELGLSL